MKKNLLALTIFFGGVFGLQAQKAHMSLSDLKKVSSKNMKAAHYNLPTENFVPEAPQHFLRDNGRSSTDLEGEIIGTTTYDLQTNQANPRRLVQRGDGTMSASWTGSTSLSTGWTDRGSFYNYFDGSSWGAAPTGRIESARTGWPVQAFTRKGEIMISHDPSVYQLRQMNRLHGDFNWTDAAMGNTIGIWPRIASSNDTVYVIYANGTGGNLDTYLTSLAKSSDGGDTWDTVNMILPGLNSANGYTSMGGDAYVIAAKDDMVAIVSGNSNNTVKLWKSMDAGDTWTTSIIMRAGIDANDTVALSAVPQNAVVSDTISSGSTTTVTVDTMAIVTDTLTSITDTIHIANIDTNQVIDSTYTVLDTTITTSYDAVITYYELRNFDGSSPSDVNNDGVADTIDCTDAGHELVIDKNGMVHVFTGYMRIFDDDPADGWSFFPGMDALLYWNESFGADSLQVIGNVRDYDNDGTLAGIGANLPNYGMGLSSMAGAAYDASSETIYCVFSSMVENSDYYEDPTNASAQSFRDLFGVYSDDYGATWTEPVNLTNSARDYYENVFASVADVADGKVHVMWQRDQEPGTSLEADPDPVGQNEIVYNAFEYTDFINAAPIALFSDSIDANILSKVHFTDNSTGDISTWSWDFDDGFISTDKNPRHTYLTNGTYNVCLTVTNPWGSNQYCKNIILDGVGIEEMDLNVGSIIPNPTKGNIQVNLNSKNPSNATISIYNILGEMITEETVNNVNGSKTLTFDISNEAEGVYFIRIQSENQLISKKVTLSK